MTLDLQNPGIEIKVNLHSGSITDFEYDLTRPEFLLTKDVVN